MQTEKKAGALFKRHQLPINLFAAIFFSNAAGAAPATAGTIFTIPADFTDCPHRIGGNP